MDRARPKPPRLPLRETPADIVRYVDWAAI